jgi:RNA polymerase sigma factor (TIGR02999 family)
LVPLVYTELRAQARRHLRKERAALTLQSTALVHELYLRLTKAPDVDWHDRGHFFALAAQIMRRILIDAARVRTARKRGGAAQCAEHSSAIDLDALPSAESDPALMLCALDDALKSLAQVDPRRARVVELRFFGGLSVEETANLLHVSPQTVMRDWRIFSAHSPFSNPSGLSVPANPQSDHSMFSLPRHRTGQSSRLHSKSVALIGLRQDNGAV